MEFGEVVRRRRMVRRYDPDRPVPADLQARMLEAGRRTPSAGFTQGVTFLVLEAAVDRERYWRCVTTEGSPDRWLSGMRTAPLLVLVWTSEAAYRRRYAEPDKAQARHLESAGGSLPWQVPYWFVDAGMAGLAVLYAAVDAGLAAAFVGVPADRVDRLRESFGVPQEQLAAGLLTIGYRASAEAGSGSPQRRARRSRDDQVRRGRW